MQTPPLASHSWMETKESMTKTTRWLVAVTICAVASGPHAAHADDIQNSPATWKRLEVRGVQLAMPMTSLKGFTCTEGAKHHKYLGTCYELTDARCKTGRCELKQDAMDQWWEIDGVKEEPEIVTVRLTDTDEGLVYQVNVKIAPRQLLDTDTTLGKALIAKYGEPTDNDPTFGTDKVGGGRMRWYNKDHFGEYPNLEVDCESNYGAFCHISLQSDAILNASRSRQQEVDDKRLKAKQPITAPKL
jgi:hypothetical protein